MVRLVSLPEKHDVREAILRRISDQIQKKPSAIKIDDQGNISLTLVFQDPDLLELLLESVKQKQTKRNQRKPAVFDPYQIYFESGIETLKSRLEELDDEQLKDIIHDYYLWSPPSAVYKKKREFLIKMIPDVVNRRATKGDCFR